MAEREPEPEAEAEESFRESYNQDPAGTTFKELQRIYAIVQSLNKRLAEVRGIMKQVDPERMDRLEMKESLRRIESELSEE